MSGRQVKVNRREIRRAAESGLRTMQEQQENAIMEAVNLTKHLLFAHQVLTQKIAQLEQRIVALEPAKPSVSAAPITAFTAKPADFPNAMVQL